METTLSNESRATFDLRVELASLRREVERVRSSSADRRAVLDAIVSGTARAVVIYDAEYDLIVVNRAAERLWSTQRQARAEPESGRSFMIIDASGRTRPLEDWATDRAVSGAGPAPPRSRPSVPLPDEHEAEPRSANVPSSEESEESSVAVEELLVAKRDGSRLFAVGGAVALRGGGGRVAGVLCAFAEPSAPREVAQTTQDAHRRASFLAHASTKLLSSSLQPDESLRQLATLAVPMIADGCTIDVVDETTGRLRRVANTWADPVKAAVIDDLLEEFDALEDDAMAMVRVSRTGTPELQPNIVDPMLAWVARSPGHLERLRSLGLCSTIVVPLLARRRVIGAVSLLAAESGRHFTPADLDMAEQLGVNAGLAVENARLYQYEQQARAVIQRAALRMDRLQAIMTDLGSALTTADVAEAVVGHGLAAVSARAASIWTISESSKSSKSSKASKLLLSSLSEAERKDWIPVDLMEPGPSADAVANETPVFVASREELVRRYPDAARRAASVCASATVPLVVRGRVWGVLQFSFDRDRELDAGERGFLGLVGAHCAQGLYRASIYEGEQRARHELALLYGLVDSVNRATTLSDVYDAALDVVHRALEVDRSSILLFDDEGAMRFRASRGLSATYLIALDGHSPWTRDTKNPVPLLVEDTEAHAASRSHRDEFRREAIRALGFFPLMHDGRLLGKFMVYSAHPRVFTDDEVRLAQTIASQISQAVVRKLSEAEAQQARTAAEYASRMKDDFLAVVSHELRTPLSSITGWAAILQSGRKNDPATLAKGLAVIERNAKAQATIIEDLLDVSRIIRGQVVLDARPIALVPLIAETMESLRTSANAKEIDVALEAEDDDFLFVADPERMRQVAWNLLSNAIKFTPPRGQVRVRLRREAGAVVVEVADTGRGISTEFLPHVFDRFRQADASTTRREGGLGLGLSIVRNLVELHGGQISVTSEGAGKGATFTMRLPVRAVVDEPISSSDASRRRGASPGGVGERPGASLGKEPDGRPVAPAQPVDPTSRELASRLDGVRVLVVDDQPDAREMLSEALSSYGAVVSVASSAHEAMGVLSSFHPEVLVSDIGMPDEDGYALLRRVRALPGPERGVPAVALTAYARIDDARRAKVAGFHSHVAKPTRPESLAAAVADALGRHATAPRAGAAAR